MRDAIGDATTSHTDLPPASELTADARGAASEPAEETAGRAAGEAAEELAGKAPPDPEILALCDPALPYDQRPIYRTIRDKRPDTADELLKSDPTAAAREAGKTLNKDIGEQQSEVKDAYQDLQETPSGSPKKQPKPPKVLSVDAASPKTEAKAAAPDPVPAQDLNLEADVEHQRERLDEAGMSTEPAQLVETGPIADARAAEEAFASMASTAPANVAAAQDKTLLDARTAMAELQAQALQALRGARIDTVGKATKRQAGTTKSEEQQRAAAGKEMRAIFTSARDRVESQLETLPQVAMAKWEASIERLSRTFRSDLDAVQKKLAEREESWGNQIIDFFFGNRWLNEQYDNAERNFVEGVCSVLIEISSEVNTIIRACQGIIGDARRDIRAVIERLPDSLKLWALQEAAGFQQQLDALEERAEQTRRDFNTNLMDRADEAVKAVKEEVDGLREAAKGFISRITDAIAAFAADPIRAIVDGLLSLAGISPASFWALVDRIGDVGAQLADEPLKFANNLLAALAKGFSQFFERFGTHLLDGFLEWLFSGLGEVGVERPRDFSLGSVVTLFLQLMGISWTRIKAILARHIGEQNVELIEKAYSLVSTLIEKGPSGIFEMIKEQLDPKTLVDMVIEMAVDYMVDTLVKVATARIIALFNPAGAIVAAVEAVYRVGKWLFENAAKIFSLVETVVNGIAAILAGDIGGMANAVETALASLIGPVIAFTADYVGLGDLPKKIAQMIGRLQARVETVLDKVIGWLATKAKALLGKLGLGEKQEEVREEDEALGKDVPIDARGEHHTLSVEVTASGVQVYMASQKKTLETHLNKYEKEAASEEAKKPIAKARELVRAIRKAGAKRDKNKKREYRALDKQIEGLEDKLRPILQAIITSVAPEERLQIPSAILVQFDGADDRAEMNRQLKLQEAGINGMYVEDWLRNRDRYVRIGRSNAGQAAHRGAIREALVSALLSEDISTGLKALKSINKIGKLPAQAYKHLETFVTSKYPAKNKTGAVLTVRHWLKSQSALHSPDQVAGGSSDMLTGVGDSDINSIIGGQWKSRAPALQADTQKVLAKLAIEKSLWRLVKMKVALKIK